MIFCFAVSVQAIWSLPPSPPHVSFGLRSNLQIYFEIGEFRSPYHQQYLTDFVQFLSQATFFQGQKRGTMLYAQRDVRYISLVVLITSLSGSVIYYFRTDYCKMINKQWKFQKQAKKFPTCHEITSVSTDKRTLRLIFQAKAP